LRTVIRRIERAGGFSLDNIHFSRSGLSGPMWFQTADPDPAIAPPALQRRVAVDCPLVLHAPWAYRAHEFTYFKRAARRGLKTDEARHPS